MNLLSLFCGKFKINLLISNTDWETYIWIVCGSTSAFKTYIILTVYCEIKKNTIWDNVTNSTFHNNKVHVYFEHMILPYAFTLFDR